RVEPPPRCQRRRRPRALGHGGVGVQRAEAEFAVSVGDGAHHGRGVEHVVVERERVAGHGVQTGRREFAPRAGPQFPCHGAQFRLSEFPGSVVLPRTDEFPARADARITQDGGSDAAGHALSSRALATQSPEYLAGGANPAGGNAAQRRPPARPPGPPARPRTRAHRRCAHRWQVFGLAGTSGSLPAVLPAVASRTEGPVLLTAFVPTHRCGAVPDSHRVPSCLAAHTRGPRDRRRAGRRTTSTPTVASRHVRAPGTEAADGARRMPRPGPLSRGETLITRAQSDTRSASAAWTAASVMPATLRPSSTVVATSSRSPPTRIVALSRDTRGRPPCRAASRPSPWARPMNPSSCMRCNWRDFSPSAGTSRIQLWMIAGSASAYRNHASTAARTWSGHGARRSTADETCRIISAVASVISTRKHWSRSVKYW